MPGPARCNQLDTLASLSLRGRPVRFDRHSAAVPPGACKLAHRNTD
jgi:hypothetical protein